MVGRGAVSLLVLAVPVGLLSVLFDIAPSKVSLPVMQLSRPAVCLGGTVMRRGHLLLCPLHVSVRPLLELGRAAHLLGRGTVHRAQAVVDRMVVMQLPRPRLSFVSLLGSLAGPVTSLARALEVPFTSLVLVASARWTSHTGQHRSTPGRHATHGVPAVVAVLK
jgi:hypothetical protein